MVSKLKEIAELAGVSESTVSRALNNSSLISEKTRQVVLNAARQLHYQTTRVGLIGVIEPNITNPLYSEIVATIEARAYDAGFGMILCNSDFDLGREQNQLDFLLRQSGVHGIILIPIDPAAGHVGALTEMNIPCVILGTDPIYGTDQVNVDASIGSYVITRHLLELGHRRIAMLQGPEWVAACRSRIKGYCKALAEFDIAFDNRLVVEGELDENGGAAAMEKLLPLEGKEITAVFAVADVMALGALRKLREVGYRVPEDISVAGCDDIAVAAQVQPALTTMWQPKNELGSLAAKLLLKQMDARKERGVNWKQMYPFQSAMYYPQIIVRESTRTLAGRK